MKYYISIIILAFAFLPAPAFAADPDPVPITLTEVDTDTDYTNEGTLDFTIVAKELAASKTEVAAAAVSVQGYMVTTFKSSLDCTGQVFKDYSFILLPNRTPYDKDGNEIDVASITKAPGKDAPIALRAWFEHQKKSRG